MCDGMEIATVTLVAKGVSKAYNLYIFLYNVP